MNAEKVTATVAAYEELVERSMELGDVLELHYLVENGKRVEVSFSHINSSGIWYDTDRYGIYNLPLSCLWDNTWEDGVRAAYREMVSAEADAQMRERRAQYEKLKQEFDPANTPKGENDE